MKHLQKFALGSILVVVAYLFVGSFNITEYRQHHEWRESVSGQQDFLTTATIKKWPIPESWIIDMIDASRERVWISVYSCTLPSLRESLVRAHKRGVDVRVILEKFPFWNTSINRETEVFLKENNIPLHLSGEKQFAFMHAKYSIIDANWIVETANWTRASFSTNREFFITGTDTSILQNLATIFETDFSGKIGHSEDIRLLAGPTNARERIIDFVELADSTIDIYAPSFSDRELLAKIAEICQAGKTIRLLLADYEDSADSALEKGTCLQVHHMKKPLHAKVIIRDKNSAFVWSFNYTENSLENNREVWIFISGEIAKSISESFESDWKLSEVALR
jgi:cardiolipin synthase A/B